MQVLDIYIPKLPIVQIAGQKPLKAHEFRSKTMRLPWTYAFLLLPGSCTEARERIRDLMA